MRHLVGTFSLVSLLQIFPVIVNAQNPENSSEIKSNYVQKVLDAKLMTTYPDGKFYPEKLVTRAELASILVKTFHLEKRQAAQIKNSVLVQDVPTSYWAFNDIQTVLKTDIMKGYRGNLFFPNQRVSRAEGFAIFAQAYGVFQFSDDSVNEILTPYADAASIPTWARKAIATVISEGFINTDGKNSIYPLRPMTRGDMAYVLSKYLQRQRQLPETPEVPGGSQNP